MSAPNLHELVDAPFGVAKQTLIEMGFWQEIDDETGKPLWRVDCCITRTVEEIEVLEIAADTEEEARRRARKEAEDMYDDVDEVDILSVCRADGP